ncbi:MAG: hypothetical protein FWE44_02850, partial [Defluviitaleaceae bacterium]|nr:hypothetical protein [Defluviitaleaceae bacterium]
MSNELNNQKNKKYGVLNLAFRTVGLYFKTARWWGVLEQLFATLHSLSWMVGIVATQILFEA